MQQAEIFWDGVAEKYAKSPIGDEDAYQYTLGRTRTYLSPTDHVLEIGCGTGSTALLLAGNAGQIIASDLSTKMIEIAQGKARDQGVSNVKFITANLFDETLDQGPYDVVMAFNLLHLIEDTEGALQRVHRLLKPDGLLISKTVCTSAAGAPLKFRLMRLIVPVMQLFGKAPYVKFMNSSAFEAMVKAQGFQILEAGDHPPPSRYIVARKV
ncbi:MAG: class I SAM-dependent methyltransferase [Rhodobacteraceae bacterium]|nr:class I SAM-dependent methyltransferase [Paracoccaceae bacterium]